MGEAGIDAIGSKDRYDANPIGRLWEPYHDSIGHR